MKQPEKPIDVLYGSLRRSGLAPVTTSVPVPDPAYVPSPKVSDEQEAFTADDRSGMVARNVHGVDAEGKNDGAQGWQLRPPKHRAGEHCDQEIIVNNTLMWQQATPIHVPGSPPKPAQARAPRPGSHQAAAMADDEIKALAKKLGDLYREPVLMRLRGISDVEIAQRFNLTIRAARERVSRGKGMLRKMAQRAAKVFERETK